MELKVGNIVELKKKHPCGSKEWEIIRTGADIKIRCLGCRYQLMLPRNKLEKSLKKIRENNAEDNLR